MCKYDCYLVIMINWTGRGECDDDAKTLKG